MTWMLRHPWRTWMFVSEPFRVAYRYPKEQRRAILRAYHDACVELLAKPDTS